MRKDKSKKHVAFYLRYKNKFGHIRDTYDIALRLCSKGVTAILRKEIEDSELIDALGMKQPR